MFNLVRRPGLLFNALVFQAVGEPPLFLASSVFFAIKNAIAAAREEEGITGNFRFDSPATSSRIRTHCVDRITEKVGRV